jgi:serine/threonine protein kinase
MKAAPFSAVAKLGPDSRIDREYSLLRAALQGGSDCFCVPLQAPIRVSDGRALLLLSDRGDPRDPTSETELLTFVSDLLTAMETLHCLGIAHRDVKPANVTICEGRAFLVDFDLATHIAELSTPATPVPVQGLHVPVMTLPSVNITSPPSPPSTPSTPSRTSSPSSTSLSTLESPESVCGPVGTIGFIAPELGRGEISTPLSDMFAVGKTIQRWLDAVPSAAVASLVQRLTEAEPLKRPTASEALEALQSLH